MFTLRVHSVVTDHPLAHEFTSISSSLNPRPSPRFLERRGIVHLFRSISHTSLPNPSSQSRLLFVVAVPNYLSFNDFIRFCGSHVNHVSELLFIRNYEMENRYSVLVKFVSQLRADGFYCNFNGQLFSPPEVEVCHLLFMLDVDLEFTESAEIAGTPPVGFVELPTCPICLERLDPDISGILSTLCDHSRCSCISKWTYLSCQVCRFSQQQDQKPTCSVCGTSKGLWVCVICGFVGCGRYEEGRHAIRHWEYTQHCYTLNLETREIWDYGCNTYVHRQNQSKTDGKLEEMNSRCMSLEGDGSTSECSEVSGISRALFSGNVEAIVDEFNLLLATQLETQRQYYESLLLEAKSKRESSILEAVESSVTSKMQEIQNKLENFTKEKKAVADISQNLIKNQEIWPEKVKEIEESIISSRDNALVVPAAVASPLGQPPHTFRGVAVKNSYVPILQSIWDVYGDIGRHVPADSERWMTTVYESLAHIVQILLSQNGRSVTSDDVKILSEITFLQRVELDVAWLAPCVERAKAIFRAKGPIEEVNRLTDLKVTTKVNLATILKDLERVKTLLAGEATALEDVNFDVLLGGNLNLPAICAPSPSM